MQKILGHQSILTTIRYTHLTTGSNDAAIVRINAMMDNITINWGNVK